jgi:hypothetical protein
LQSKINQYQYRSGSAKTRLEVLNQIVGSTEEARLEIVDRISTYCLRMKMLLVRTAGDNSNLHDTVYNSQPLDRDRAWLDETHITLTRTLPPPSVGHCLMIKYGENDGINRDYINGLINASLNGQSPDYSLYTNAANHLQERMSHDIGIFTSTSEKMFSTSVQIGTNDITIEKAQRANLR